MNRRGVSETVATVFIVGTSLFAAISIGYFVFIEPSSKQGYYAEVVGATPQGNPIARFIYFHKSDSSSGYCPSSSTRILHGAYQIRNQTFFYFYPTIQLGNIIGTNVSATQQMYQRGAICP